MTVTYTSHVPNGSTFGCFWKVLLLWKGSVYKLVWRELLVYLILYYLINILYRFGLNEDQQRQFESIRTYFNQQNETIPMSFVLAFYVTLVVSRWWQQYKLLPWPDTLALFLNAGIPGANERQRLMRRNIIRYAVLAYVITLQRVSLRVKKRFPSWQHVVDSGLMMESEKKIFELMDTKTPMSKYWMPLVWATNIINRARKEELIKNDHIVQTLLTELSDIRRRLGALIGFDTVCVPLVYTQVVTLALYVYFFTSLLGRQFVYQRNTSPGGKYEQPDVYFPFFTTVQFFFYVGWLKVAEVLINPFGEDDDDIELNWLIDRHIKASYMIVDEMHEEHPELLKDQYWDEVVPNELPYTVASENYRREEPKGSADNFKVKGVEAMYANLMPPKKSPHDDMYADYESVDTPIVERRKSSNWFSRQISRTRMGSIRSASTAYSSGGLFGRHRANSVYANPENGQPPSGLAVHNAQTMSTQAQQMHQQQQPQQQNLQKMSIYDRLVGRKSGRNSKNKGTKLNGAAPMQVRNRPRIPTPDVTKESSDIPNHQPHLQQHNRFTTIARAQYPQTATSTTHSIPATAVLVPPPSNTTITHQVPSITLLPHSLPAYPAYPTHSNGGVSNDSTPMVQVVLSPIQELDTSLTAGGSVNNTLHASQPGTAALAQAILSPGLGPVLSGNGSGTPVSVTIAHSLNSSPLVARAPAALLKIFEQKSANGNGTGSCSGGATLSEIQTPSPIPEASSSGDAETSSKDNSSSLLEEIFKSEEMLQLNSAPNSINSTNEDSKSRKTSIISQNNMNNSNANGNQKRGEVYV